MNIQTGWSHFPFEEVDLNPSNLPSKLNNLRIIQLSDMHLTAKVDIKYIRELVVKINKSQADLVLFTGDIIQCSALKLKTQLSELKNIEVQAFYVTGNHDIVYGPEHLRTILEDSNVTCLDNSIATISIKGELLQLVGVSDRYSFVRGIKRNVKQLFSQLDSSIFTILLAHQPKDIKYIDNYRIDIQLSGHTHGGQIYPFTLIVKLFQEYFAGLYTYKNTILYVTRGLGYWGVALRYKASSEIPILNIKSRLLY